MAGHTFFSAPRGAAATSKRAVLSASAGVAALLFAAPAFAAEAAPADQTGVSEVVVTANKLNSTKVLQTPGAIQAISGASLQRAGTIGFLDVAGKIPGLSVQDLGPGDRKYVIRGINSTGDSTTGVYYDEAVISGANADDGGGFESDIRLYDMDHIEVLRGPQGTLYGASSMSGTIRFITNKPNLNDFGGYLNGEVSGTSHGGTNYDGNGEINLPIIPDKVALRIVGWSVNDSGYIDQVRLGVGTSDPVGVVKGVNNDDVQGGRVSLRIQPIEALTIDASFTDQRETSNGSSRYTPAGTTAFQIPGTPTIQGCDLCNTDVTRSPATDDLQVYSLTAAYKFQYGTITGTTNQYNRRIGFTFDSTPILVSFGVPEDAVTEEPRTQRVNSSEIRYASDFDFPVNFVVGGFREYQTTDLTVDVVASNGYGNANGPFSRSNSQDALSTPTGNTFFGRTDFRETTQYAAFGEATWKVTPQLTLVGGLRYFTEDLQGVQDQTHPFGGFPAGPIQGPIADQSQNFSKVTFKFNASYKFSDDLLAYATASQGFRSGGLNGLSQPFEATPPAFRPDSLWNYEAGLKGKLFDGRLDYQVDGYALFWYDIQVQETTPDGAFVYQGNAGNAAVQGTEFEFNARPIQYFTVSLAGSYQDAYLTRGASAAQKLLNPTLGVTGEDIPNVPKFQFNLGLNYTAPLAMIPGDWKGTAAADITYRDSEDSYFSSNSFNIRLKAYTLLNLRAGVSTGPWSAMVFVRNATDDRAQISAINSSQDPDALLTVRPRTIGISVNRTF